MSNHIEEALLQAKCGIINEGGVYRKSGPKLIFHSFSSENEVQPALWYKGNKKLTNQNILLACF